MRHLPDRAFPPYAFLPGRDPHPTRDPEGHSYGREEPPPTYLAAERWGENVEYLWGVDLYNHGFLWEAHEAWEGLWHAAKRDERQAEFLQGLIQCTAACLKVRMDEPRGSARLCEAGTARLERAAGEESLFMGLDVPAFVHEMRSFVSGEPTSSEGRPRLKLAGPVG